ncbi:MAG: EamA family transporter [Pseudomonadota bacterium]
MTASILYAMLSLVCAGVNDLFFKRYAARERSRGAYVFGIGTVWAALQISLALGGDVGLAVDNVTLAYGLVAGVLLTVSNLLLLESLSHINVSLGTTTYRLNTVVVVLLSMAFLHEPLGTFKGLGVVLGVLAVLLLYERSGRRGVTGRQFKFFFALAILASLSRAIYGVVSKAGLTNGAVLQSLLVIAAVCWMGGGVGYAILGEKRFRITIKMLLYSTISGVLVFLIVNFLLLAIEQGEASIVIPIANMSFLVSVVLSVGLGMEQFSRRKSVAVILSACAMILLSMSD